MGVQSFNEDIIKKENRLYSSKQDIERIYNECKSFARIVNVDLLAGLYDQTSDILLDDVKTLLDIGVESITIYELNRVGIRSNKESSRKHITSMLIDVYNKYGKFKNYNYLGTTSNDFQHCNRFYKKINTFLYYYNPSPQGYNNVISFSIDDNIKINPYSHFTSINKAYNKKFNFTHFYKFQNAIFRPHWKNALDKRNKAGKQC